LLSLCGPHHSSIAQQIETLGYSRAIGADGFPVDVEHHPFFTGKVPPKPKKVP
jgi:hypothetical protein